MRTNGRGSREQSSVVWLSSSSRLKTKTSEEGD